MKTSCLRHLAAAAALMLAAATQTSFAQTATTDPVGFITATVQGGSASVPKYTLISPTLVKPVSWQGKVTAFGASSISVALGSWIAGQFDGANGKYYVEVISNSTVTVPTPGSWADILTTTNSTITTNVDLSGTLAVGASIRIRAHMTLNDVFGANNSAGLLGSATDASAADEVFIYSGSTPAGYFYFTGGFGYSAGWYDSEFNAIAPIGAAVAIAPSNGVVVKRKTAGNVSIVVSGAVKTGNTSFPVYNNYNFLGTISAAGLTLNSSGLYTGNAATGIKPSAIDATSADEVTIYTGSTSASYFYYNGGLGYADGWYDSAFNATSPIGGSVNILPGTSFVIRRKGGGPFVWSAPAPTSF